MYPILATAAPCIYPNLAIANKELYIFESYPWFHSAQQQIFGLVETRVHAALAMPVTLDALGAVFQDFPALCPCEPRLPRGEMQAVPCGARSNTRLLPAYTSQCPLAGIRSVRKYNAGICIFVQVKTVLTFGHVWLPRKKTINTPGQPRPQTLSLLPRRAAARAVGERRPVYPCLHPCPRTHVEIRGRKGPGRRGPKPHTNPIYMYTAATSAACCCYCC